MTLSAFLITDKQDWRLRGKCFGTDTPDAWDVISLPSHEPQRSQAARKLCAGCPVDVQSECLRHAVKNGIHGMVVAGIPMGRDGRSREAAAVITGESAPARLRRGRPSLGWPRQCRGCDRPMRPSNGRSSDWPDTVACAARDTCRSCWNHSGNSVPLPGPRRVVQLGDPCKGCQRPLRPHHTTKSQHPGTVAHKSGGYCYACGRRAEAS